MQDFLAGPGLIISLLVFVLGLAWRVLWYVRGLDWKLDRVAYRPHMKLGLKGAVHSALLWMVPFATYSWRNKPIFTLCTFLFHIGVAFVPLFLAGHAVLLESAVGFSLPALPQGAADCLTILAVIALVLLALRRLTVPEVRLLTTRNDWGILFLAGIPLVTGCFAAAHLPGYETWLTLHMLSGEVMLIAAPFTKLSHIVLYFMSRGQLGMDYAIKRGGEYRGPAFPW